MDRAKKNASKTKAFENQNRAKRSLGLARRQHLPRCGDKVTKKVKAFEAKGDFSHSDPAHICNDCSCKLVAGQGTNHLGVGWCVHHEKVHPNKDCEYRIKVMTEAIRAGYPEKAYRYKSGSKYLKKIQDDADEASELISLRENQMVMINMIQVVLNALDGKEKPDGTMFTESGKDGPERASDATLVKLMATLMNAMTKTVKVELEVQDEDYVHWDECAVFFSNILKVVESFVDPETLKKILHDLTEVKQPRRGRKRRR